MCQRSSSLLFVLQTMHESLNDAGTIAEYLIPRGMHRRQTLMQWVS